MILHLHLYHGLMPPMQRSHCICVLFPKRPILSFLGVLLGCSQSTTRLCATKEIHAHYGGCRKLRDSSDSVVG